MNEGETTRVAVMGAGAVGSVLSATLWRAGVRVEVVSKPEKAAELAAREGIRVEGAGIGRTFTARPRVVADATELSGRPDVVLLATKATDVIAASREILPMLGPRTTVVVMQNGLCEEAVAEVVGDGRIVGCTVQWGATLVGPAHSRRTSRGGFTVGRLGGGGGGGLDSPLMRAADVLRACAPVRVTSNIVGARYAKLVVNSCETTLGAVSGLTLRDTLALRAGRELFLRTATEVIDVARALGVRLEPLDGFRVTWLYVDPAIFEKQFSLDRGLKELALRTLAWLRGGVVSSSLQSLRRGEPTEIDYLNGHVVRKAAGVGIPVPVNERLVRMVREIERGARPIGPWNLQRPGVREA